MSGKQIKAKSKKTSPWKERQKFRRAKQPSPVPAPTRRTPNQDTFAELLRQHGVLLHGHFLLSSGRHSAQYFEKFRILENPALCETFAQALASRFVDKNPTVVCGPTTGGVIIAYEVARQLQCRCVIAEKTDSGRKIGRGFKLGPEDRVLVVDDVMTTGGSLVETLTALDEFPSKVVGVGVFIDRSGGNNKLGQPYSSVYSQTMETWDPGNCPLCRSGTPLSVPGRGGG
ncbi:MAG: orotate phosphoribosyltransferase [candidate division WOR-3 bacterium]